MMQQADTGSVVVTEHGKVVGILTERDLLRAAVGAGDPRREQVRLWMTARPDVLGPDERVDAAWAQPHVAPLPPPPRGRGRPVRRRRLAPRPDGRGPHPARRRDERRRAAGPRGRGRRRDDHRRRARARRASSTTASTRRSTWPRRRSLEDVWHLLFRGELPDAAASRAFADAVRERRIAAAGPAHVAAGAGPAGARRSTCCAPPSRSSAPSSAGGRRTTSSRRSSTTRRSGSAPSCRRSWRRRTGLREGEEPVEPRSDLGHRGQLPLHADRGSALARRTPGPLSST